MMPRGPRRREQYYPKAVPAMDPCAGMGPRAPCARDATLGIMVHRFDVGMRLCRCGELNLNQAHDELPASVQERLRRL